MQRASMTRRAALLGAAAFTSGLPARAEHVRVEPLFVIARSKNANVVHYDARLLSDGRLDPEEPLIVYWVMHAEDGRREALTWLERRLAYGFSAELEPRGALLRVRLRAFSRREIAVRRDGNGRFHAGIAIAGQPAWLERIFVSTDESGVTPRVRYLELFGRASVTGVRVAERLTG